MNRNIGQMPAGTRPNSRAEDRDGDSKESVSITKLELKDNRNMSQQRAKSIPIPVSDSCCQRPGSPVICDTELDGAAMDKYLASIGLSRKAISPENSLHRAICEEVYFCQRTDLMGFVTDIVEQTAEVDFKTTRIREGDEDMIPGDMGDRLRAAAKIFDAVIRVFKYPNIPPLVYYPPDRRSIIRQILLCETRPRHFDSVIQLRRLEVSETAKAILYDSLYTKVCRKTKSIEKDENNRDGTDLDSTGEDSQTEATSINNSKQQSPGPEPSHEQIHPPIIFSIQEAMDLAAGDRSVSRDDGSSEGRQKSTAAAEREPPVPFPVGSLCLARTEGGAQRARVLAVQDAINRKLIFEDATVKVVSIYELRNGTKVAKPEPSEDDATPISTTSQQRAVPYMGPMTPLSAGFLPMGTIQQYICEPLLNNSFMPQQNNGLPDFSTPPPNYTMNHQPPQRSCSVTEQIMHNYSIPPVGYTIEQQQSFMAAYSQQQPPFVPVMPQQSPSVPNYQQDSHQSQQQYYLPMSPVPSDGSIGEESVFGSNSLDGQSSRLPAVPYFNEYDLQQVATSSSYSASSRGDDLPDVLTTRYYFNLGVNYARRLKTEKIRADSSNKTAPPPHMIPNPPQNFVMQPSPCYCMPSPQYNNNHFPTSAPSDFTSPSMVPVQPVVYTPIGPPQGTVYFSLPPPQQQQNFPAPQ